jgi:hypothetical protein
MPVTKTGRSFYRITTSSRKKKRLHPRNMPVSPFQLISPARLSSGVLSSVYLLESKSEPLSTTGPKMWSFQILILFSNLGLRKIPPSRRVYGK